MFILLARVGGHHGLAFVGGPQIGGGFFAKPLLRLCSDAIKKPITPIVDIPLGEYKQAQDAGKSAKAEDNEPGSFDGLIGLNIFAGSEAQSESLKLAAAALKVSGMPIGPNANFSETENYRKAEQTIGTSSGENPENQTKKLAEAENNAQELAALKKEVEDWRKKNLELLEKYRLALEDQKKLYGRLNKQVSNAQFFGITSFCRDLLDVADALGTAAKLVDLSRVNMDEHEKELYDSVVVAKDTLIRVFRNHGLQPIQPLHQKYDPDFHEALFQRQEPDMEPNTVIEVVKLGYKLHERVIRAALVGISRTVVVDPKTPPVPETPTST